MRSYFNARPAAGSRQKGKNMEKLVLKDNTEIEIRPGASIGSITAAVADFTALGAVAGSLTQAGNLDEVRFKSDEILTGEYANMKLETPLFRSVDILDGKVLVTFGIRRKTEMELAIEELRSGQDLQDGAIADLGEVVSTIAEGGTL